MRPAVRRLAAASGQRRPPEPLIPVAKPGRRGLPLCQTTPPHPARLGSPRARSLVNFPSLPLHSAFGAARSPAPGPLSAVVTNAPLRARLGELPSERGRTRAGQHSLNQWNGPRLCDSRRLFRPLSRGWGRRSAPSLPTTSCAARSYPRATARLTPPCRWLRCCHVPKASQSIPAIRIDFLV